MKIIKMPILILEERIHFTLLLFFCYTIFCWQFTFTGFGLLTLSLGVVCLFTPFIHFLYLLVFIYRKPTFDLKHGGWLEESLFEFNFSDFPVTLTFLIYFFSLKWFLLDVHYMLFSLGSLLLLFSAIFVLGISEYLKSEYEPESKVIRLMIFDSKIVFFKRNFITEFDLKNVDKIENSDHFVEIWTSSGFLQEFDFINFDDYDMEKFTDFCEKINNRLAQ